MKIYPPLAIADSRILVVGTVRNVQKTIESEIEKLRQAVSEFKAHRFYIVESDSEDRTLDILNKIKNAKADFDFISLGSLRDSVPKRIERIATSRNVYVDYAKSNLDLFDFVLVADLDGVNFEISSEKIASCFTRSDWGACTANQSGPYYDIYALRAKDWVEIDCVKEFVKFREDGEHPLSAWTKAVREKQIIIPSQSPWIEVTSAFGGLAIYKIEAFVCGSYKTRSSQESNISEHVAFHEAIREAGWRIFINPFMTNSDYNEHNDFHRLSRRAKHSLKYLISLIAPTFYVNKFMPNVRVK